MRAPASPQLRFLLRGSSLFIAMLALWWWVLLHPMLDGLQFTTGLALRLFPGGSSVAQVEVDSRGDWMLRVPVPASLVMGNSAPGSAPAGSPPVKYRPVRLTIAERVPTFFTLSFPLFWALVLAAPRSRRLPRALLGGTALLALLAVLSLLLYTAYTIGTNLSLIGAGLAASLFNAAEYLNLNVAPYVAPFFLALWLHPELRSQILTWDVAPAPPAVAGVPEEPPRRGRARNR